VASSITEIGRMCSLKQKHCLIELWGTRMRGSTQLGVGTGSFLEKAFEQYQREGMPILEWVLRGAQISARSSRILWRRGWTKWAARKISIEWKYREYEDHFKPIHEQPKGDSGVSGRFAGIRSYYSKPRIHHISSDRKS
jgi:hypothetical protein